MNRWNYEMVFQFLDALQNYPSIWEKSHPDYKNKFLKAKAMNDLAEDLRTIGFSQSATDLRVIKAKVKTLKDTYLAELKKVLSYQASGERLDYKPKLIWFDRADSIFRHTYRTKKSSTANMLVEELSEFAEVGACEENDNSAEIPTYIELSATDPISPKRSKQEDLDHTYNSIPRTTKLPSFLNSTPRAEKLPSSLNSIPRAEKLPPSLSDEFDCITKSWAITLKKLSLENAWEAQDKITMMLREYVRKEQSVL